MSGICDTCKREPCHMRFDGCKTCDVYEGGESNYTRLFGTPELAAETMFTLMLNCARGDGPCERCPAFPRCNWVGDDGEEPESMMLEWLRDDAK